MNTLNKPQVKVSTLPVTARPTIGTLGDVLNETANPRRSQDVTSVRVVYAATIATLIEGVWSLRIPVCPFCKAEHWHGGTDHAKPLLGTRSPHCRDRSDVHYLASYELVLIGGLK
jgi:hypothetical protein